MDDLKGVFNLVIVVVVVAATLLGPIIERWRRRQAELRGAPPPPPPEPEAEPESKGPTLPYESVVEEIFGPYMARRRAAHAAREQEEAPEAPEAAVEVVEEAPAPPVPAAAAKGVEGAAIRPVPAAAAPARVSLEERLFGARRLGDAARLILAAEILQPPRSLRGRSRGR